MPRLESLVSSGLAVSTGETAKPILFEGFQAGCHVVLRGRRVTSQSLQKSLIKVATLIK